MINGVSFRRLAVEEPSILYAGKRRLRSRLRSADLANLRGRNHRSCRPWKPFPASPQKRCWQLAKYVSLGKTSRKIISLFIFFCIWRSVTQCVMDVGFFFYLVLMFLYDVAQGKKWQTQQTLLHNYKSSVFERLSDDLVLRIFSFLVSSQLALCGRVCRRWHVLAWEPQLWSTITLSGDNLSADRALKVKKKKTAIQQQQPLRVWLKYKMNCNVTDNHNRHGEMVDKCSQNQPSCTLGKLDEKRVANR